MALISESRLPGALLWPADTVLHPKGVVGEERHGKEATHSPRRVELITFWQ